MAKNKTTKRKNNWFNHDNNYYIESISKNIGEIPVGIYRLEHSDMKGLYLTHTGDKFTFPYKIYGMERNFIDRVIKTYNSKNGNVGILLNGVKGTGKTVTAEIIANEINLPVIVINQNYQNATATFINSIEQDVILFFDEYEKTYSNHDYSILTVMDGVLSTKYRRLFLLTTNNDYINENMLSRPSRIRYVKQFGDLSLDVINEIVDDMLDNKDHKEALIRYVSTLRIITVDIVKSIVDEVNIHNEDPQLFKDIFNVKIRDEKYNVFDLTDSQENPIKLFSDVDISPCKFNGDTLERVSGFEVQNSYIGKIVDVINESTFVIELDLRGLPSKSTKEILEDGVRNNEIFNIVNETDDEDSELKSLSDAMSINDQLTVKAMEKITKVRRVRRVIKIEQSYGQHYSFRRYTGNMKY